VRCAALAIILMPVLFGIAAAVVLGAPWGSRASSAPLAAPLACSVKASCGTDEVAVFRMSSTSNAHAGTPSGSTYANRVCCTKLSGVGTQCSGTYDAVLSLSGADDAHVASDGSYATRVCLSGGDDSGVDCTYAGACLTDYACLATISGSTNAHVADCNGVDDYGTKVCCLARPDNCPAVPNPGQENLDGDQWGDACDFCPTAGTPWYVPLGDEDCDGFTTTIEQYVGTDPLDACRDNPSDAAWPLDVNNDGQVSVVGDVLNFRGRVGAIPGAPNWSQRLDFNGDGQISVVGDVLMYRGLIGETCT
jgi:hypothetical protein